jgi:hypothetical protein
MSDDISKYLMAKLPKKINYNGTELHLNLHYAVENLQWNARYYKDGKIAYNNADDSDVVALLKLTLELFNAGELKN